MPNETDESSNIKDNIFNRHSYEREVDSNDINDENSEYNNYMNESEVKVTKNSPQQTENISISFPIDNSTQELSKQIKKSASILNDTANHAEKNTSGNKSYADLTPSAFKSERGVNTQTAEANLVSETSNNNESEGNINQNSVDIKKEDHVNATASSKEVDVYDIHSKNKSNRVEEISINNSVIPNTDPPENFEKESNFKSTSVNSPIQYETNSSSENEMYDNLNKLNSEIDLEKLRFDYLTKYVELYSSDQRNEFRFFVNSLSPSELDMSYETWLEFKIVNIHKKFEVIQNEKLKRLKEAFRDLKDNIANLNLDNEEDIIFLRRLWENINNQ